MSPQGDECSTLTIVAATTVARAYSCGPLWIAKNVRIQVKC